MSDTQQSTVTETVNQLGDVLGLDKDGSDIQSLDSGCRECYDGFMGSMQMNRTDWSICSKDQYKQISDAGGFSCLEPVKGKRIR